MIKLLYNYIKLWRTLLRRQNSPTLDLSFRSCDTASEHVAKLQNDWSTWCIKAKILS